MWAHTRTHLTETSFGVNVTSDSNFKKNNWRELFDEKIEAHSEQGLYLKGLRLRDGYTQEELGIMLGVLANNISAMERGRRKIGKAMAHKLSKVFKVKYQKFL